jgi:hypothetical protein
MSLGAQLRELFEGLSELAAQHVELAKLELRSDARFIGARVGVIAALAPLILVGYGCLCAAAALALARVLAVDLAFLVVGVVNLLAGVVGIAIAARQLGERRVLSASAEELEASRAAVLRRVPASPTGSAGEAPR